MDNRPDFPTREQVEKASHEQLARWYRFLPSGDMRAAEGLGQGMVLFFMASAELPRMARCFRPFWVNEPSSA